MNFTSLEFILFFPLVCLGYRLFPVRMRLWLLLMASYLFYLCDSPWATLLLLFATFVSYRAALRITGETTEKGKKLWLMAAVGVCLGMLVFFKYTDFFLPIGISFYTFQTLSYVIDVYRGEIKAERHFGYYALFIAFFPQLVAGPIERPENLLPQLKRMTSEMECGRVSVRQRDMISGLFRMLCGFFKKLVIADYLAVFVDRVYGAPAQANGFAVIFGTVLFAFQIYCDFSGYSDIACGGAKMLGIRLMENFNQPYLARSVQDFWRRWHISLTGWLTDYIYKPLGGSRRGMTRQCINIMLVFFCSGLWHGMAWHYVVWGLLHGVYLVAETLWRNKTGDRSAGAAGKRNGLRRARTFLLVCFAWIFFRASGVNEALLMIGKLGSGWSVSGVKEAWSLLGMSGTDVLQIVLGIGCMALMNQKKDICNAKYRALGCYYLVMAVLLAWLVILSGDGGNAFIYFQF